jgi:hypothetical protein
VEKNDSLSLGEIYGTHKHIRWVKCGILKVFNIILVGIDIYLCALWPYREKQVYMGRQQYLKLVFRFKC